MRELPLSIEFQTAAALDEMAAGDRDQNLEANTIDGTFTLVPETDGDAVDPETGEISPADARPEASKVQAKAAEPPVVNVDAFAERLEKCADLDVLDLAADEIRDMPADDQAMLREVYQRRRQELQDRAEKGRAEPHPERQSAAAHRRQQMNIE